MRQHPSALTTLALLSAAVLLALTGCTIGNTSPPSSAPVSAPSGSAPAGGAPATSATASGSPMPEAVLASRKTSFGGQSASIDLNEVAVSAGVTNLTWTITNTATRGDLLLSAGPTRVTSIFGDGQQATVPGSDEAVAGDAGSADGVFLIDSVNKRRYLPARDDRGVCVCSRFERFEVLAPGLSRVVSATFRAVPQGVDVIAVSIPGAGTFSGVPVTR